MNSHASAVIQAAIELVTDVKLRHPEVEKEGYRCPFMQHLADTVALYLHEDAHD